MTSHTDGPLSVMFLINSLGGGGAERSTALVLPYLRDLGIDPTVVTLYRSEHGTDEERVRAQGFEVVVLRAGDFRGRLRELRHLLRERRPTVLHTALYDSDILGRVASWRLPVRVVSSLVSTPYDEERKKDPSLDRRKIAAVQTLDAITARLFVDRMQAVSLGAAKANSKALRYPMSRITVVERGRDETELGCRSEQRRQTVRAALGVDPAAPMILAVGRSDHAKAHDDLVRAFGRLLPMLPDARLLIAGRPGNAHDRLEDVLRSDPLVARAVSLLGHRNDVPDLLAASDVLAICSRIEGTAGVALEAMGLGVPVVSTKTVGVEGILEDGRNAALAAIGNPEAFSSQLLSILRDRERARGLVEHGTADFVSRFTVAASASRLKHFYVDIDLG